MNDVVTLPPFVSAEWLAAHHSEVVVADARWYLDGSSGREAFEAGHLPGAVFVDLDQWLSGPGSPETGRNPLPAPGVFAEGMTSLGISNHTPVVAYDDAGGVIAARLVWMLRVTGHQAAVLDGGMAAWAGPLESGPGPLAEPAVEPATQPAMFKAVPWPDSMLAGIDELALPGVTVADARNADRFEGRQDPIDPRPGHIPGAVNVPCRANLEPSGRIKNTEEILQAFAAAGIDSAEKVISYCGSGVTACHNLLTMEHVGLGRGLLYVGGWSQYGHALDRPVETGRSSAVRSPAGRNR